MSFFDGGVGGWISWGGGDRNCAGEGGNEWGYGREGDKFRGGEWYTGDGNRGGKLRLGVGVKGLAEGEIGGDGEKGCKVGGDGKGGNTGKGGSEGDGCEGGKAIVGKVGWLSCGHDGSAGGTEGYGGEGGNVGGNVSLMLTVEPAG